MTCRSASRAPLRRRRIEIELLQEIVKASLDEALIEADL